MANSQRARTTREKLAIFGSCFTGLTTVYGTYDPQTGRVYVVKEPVTDQVFLRHLQGRRPYGVYLLSGDRTRAIAVDFDQEDRWPPLEFVFQSAHYGIRAYLERSKRKGWHAWIFLELPGVSAAKARLVIRAVLDDIGMANTEVFPKQDRLTSEACYGNFINVPLFGALVPAGRTVFVDPREGFKPFPDQWDLLQNVQRTSESLLDQIIQINELIPSGPTIQTPEAVPAQPVTHAFGLPPCAQRMLAEGVKDYQRVACFRLALHLKKAGIPEDIAVAGLRAWARKNRPTGDRRIITDGEIAEQVRSAYRSSYRGCGCQEPAVRPYCDSGCPLQTRSTSPPRCDAGPSPHAGG